MSIGYQLEALLRPPVELLSALHALLTGFVVLIMHRYLYMSAPLAWATFGLFACFALWRTRQGWRIVRYHQRLLQLPRFVLHQRRVPTSRRQLYVGRGFKWEAKHTQRLRDCLLPLNERYLRERWRHRIGREWAVACEGTWLSGISRILNWDHPLNLLRPRFAVGGRPEIHGVGLYEGEKNMYSPLDERVGHTLVLGTTRVGKTRFAEILITQDIRRGDTVIVFDPKGDAELVRSIYAACRDSGRLDEFYMFHLAYPEHSVRYNPIGSYSRITQVATRIANSLPGEGSSAAFKEFGWRFTNVIAQALHMLDERPTYALIQRHVNNIDNLLIRYGQHWLEKYGPADWREQVNEVNWGLTGDKGDPDKPSVMPITQAERSHDVLAVCIARVLSLCISESDRPDPVADGLLSAVKYDKTYFDKITASLGPFLEKLTTGLVADLFSPTYDADAGGAHTFDWASVIRSNNVVYVGLAALQDVTVASAVGNAMFSDLTATAGELYAYGPYHGMSDSLNAKEKPIRPVSIHADEFNELIGDEFIPMLNKAGGAGYQVTAYTQTWSDVEARIGNRAKAEQIAGNFNTVHMLRVRNKETAELLTDMLPNVQVSHLTTVSGATHSTDPTSDTHFGSSVQDRLSTSDVPMLEPGDLTRLPKGQSFMLKEGAQLYKLRLPLLRGAADSAPAGIEALTARMKADYHDSGYLRDDTWWSQMMPTPADAVAAFKDAVYATGSGGSAGADPVDGDAEAAADNAGAA